MRRLPLALGGAALLGGMSLSGCASGGPFVYQPGPPLATSPRYQVKVVVLPFQDKTGDLTRDAWNINMAKVAVDGPWYHTPALDAAVLGNALAQELRASGLFADARFEYELPEPPGGDIVLRGTVHKALAVAHGQPREFHLDIGFEAVSLGGKKRLWGDRLSESWETYDDVDHAMVNGYLRGIFRSAIERMAGALDEAGMGSSSTKSPSSGGVASESVDDILKKINAGE